MNAALPTPAATGMTLGRIAPQPLNLPAALPVPTLAPATPPPASPYLAPWSRSSQVATSLCVLVALGWTALHASDYLLHGARPLDLQHGPEPVPRLDLNRASRTELQHLPGIGPVLAERIVEYRSARGPFRSVEDLLKVDGIGLAKLERIRSLVMVRGETAMRNAARSTDTNPTRPTIENPTETRPGAIPPPKPPGKKVLDLAGAKINVNQASALELQRLPGIGPKLSERIIAERAKARFRSVEELRRVPGIGPKTLEKLRPHVTVD